LSATEQRCVRKRIEVSGIVQGVGFRPFVYQLAQEHGLAGWVLNDSQGVKIEVEGEWERINRFVAELQARHPALARITRLEQQFVPRQGGSRFEIRKSVAREERGVLISPDTNVCGDCLRELFDPRDRRYRYPFINCTNCGPRYTIIDDVPYDRPNTTMRKFPMCAACEREYRDPADRRFHAQPNACPACGPQVTLLDAHGRAVECDDPIRQTARLLKQGRIVATKGLGGFHLTVDATSDEAVRTLRIRKRREEKPLGIMSSDVEAVRKYAHVSDAEEALLRSFRRPIVLLKRRSPCDVAESVAPRSKSFGAMLPCTPIQYLILNEGFLALVMTSGNISEEPIAIGNDEAVRRLQGIADFCLAHDRDIYLRSDDSVARVTNGKEVVLRRSRGYVPVPMVLDSDGPDVLAVGPELKNTVCVTRGRHAFLSQHVGDMKNVETYEFFEKTIAHMRGIMQVNPRIVAYDLHPLYMSSRWALEQEEYEKKISVQHHHAHVAAALAEHGLQGPVIGVTYDGTGYGTDGRIWGGEILAADCRDFERVAHLRYIPLPGGDAAVKETDRIALSYLLDTYGESFADLDVEFCRALDPARRRVFVQMIRAGVNAPLTSSMGRLFDAVSALLGVCKRVSYEGQAAMELEACAAEDCHETYKYVLDRQGACWVMDVRPAVRQIVDDIRAGTPNGVISARFHNTILALTADTCCRVARERDLWRVALSGGCFQNEYLMTRLPALLEERGFRVLVHREVPPNDGGIALGQAAIARTRATESAQ